jgi:hypothetical protein
MAEEPGVEHEQDLTVDHESTPVAAVSWILELPRHLGLRQDTTSSVGTAGNIPDEWIGRLDQLPEWPDCKFKGIPRKRLRFRRALVGIGMPTEATDRAFRDLRRMSGMERLRHTIGLWRLSRRGVKEWKTVCQMTKWYSGPDVGGIGRSRAGSRPPLERDFYELLGDLDLWLQTYGLVSGEVEVGSIALHDLPPIVPWTIHIKESPDTPELVLTGMLPLHERVPDLLEKNGNQEAAEEAGFLFGVGTDTIPAFAPLALLFQAQGAALAGRGRQAVMDAGTAVESMVALVLREGLRAKGKADSEIEGILGELKWRDIYNRELLKFLGVPAGQGGAAHAKWWRVHYKRRNDAVHGGLVPSQDDASEMISDTWDLFEWIGEQAREQPDLAKFGKTITVRRK